MKNEPLLLFGGLILGLALAALALLRLVGWLRKTASRYLFFELFSSVFMVGVGVLYVLSPREAVVPLWIVGLSIVLIGAWSAVMLLARRMKWKWLSKRIGEEVLRCSFCNKSQRDVMKLIAGPNVYICDECVGVCLTILSEDRGPAPESPEPRPVSP